MSSDKATVGSSFIGDLLQFSLYKPSQGRIARQVTGAAIAIAAGAGAWAFRDFATGRNWFSGAELLLPAILFCLGLWFSYRIVNIPRFADFLIAVEAEMNKVSWPSKPELYRSTFVVIFVIIVLTALLFGFDLLFQIVFQGLGILKTGGGGK